MDRTKFSSGPELFINLIILFCLVYIGIITSFKEQTIVPQLTSKFKIKPGFFNLLARVDRVRGSNNVSSPLAMLNVSISRKLAATIVDDDNVPQPELEALSKAALIEEERKYYHDDQFLMYKDRCPTSVRYKIANNSHFKHKYIEDMPVLMWDKHLTPEEYKRMFRFLGINGLGKMSYKNLAAMLRKMNTRNNVYMFDDLLHLKEGTRKDCISCAIIGNGGILNGSKMGEEIDSHDYVFRVNTALTKGFEEDVGNKTSFYCFTMVTLTNTLRSSRKFGFKAPPSPPGIRYLVFADIEATYIYFGAHFAGQKVPPGVRFPPKFDIPVTPENVKIVHPDFERYLKWSWVNSPQQHKPIHRPSTGAIMLLVALHTCDEVDAYGFGGSYTKYSDHYYEPKFSQHRFYANHDDRTEQKLWHLLNEEKIIKLYTRDDYR